MQNQKREGFDTEGVGPRCRNQPCGPLSLLLEQMNSNKVMNGYGAVYDILFRSAAERLAVRAVLEIGVGTVDPNAASTMSYWAEATSDPNGPDEVPYRPGASLRAWRAIFPHALVVG